MVEAGELEGLAEVPPGPGLSATLDALNLAQVPGDRLVEVLRAQARQCAHEQARMWAAMVKVGLADPADCDGPGMRGGTVGDWAAGEIAAALTWTHRTADWELGLAEIVVRKLRTSSPPCLPGGSTGVRPWSSPSNWTPPTASPRLRPGRSWPGCCRSRRG